MTPPSYQLGRNGFKQKIWKNASFVNEPIKSYCGSNVQIVKIYLWNVFLKLPPDNFLYEQLLINNRFEESYSLTKADIEYQSESGRRVVTDYKALKKTVYTSQSHLLYPLYKKIKGKKNYSKEMKCSTLYFTLMLIIGTHVYHVSIVVIRK